MKDERPRSPQSEEREMIKKETVTEDFGASHCYVLPAIFSLPVYAGTLGAVAITCMLAEIKVPTSLVWLNILWTLSMFIVRIR